MRLTTHLPRAPEWKAFRIRPHRRSDDADFYAWTGPRPVTEIEGLRLMGPACYHPFETFRSIHLASYDAVRDVLPTSNLHPVRWFDGRAVVMIAAMRYREVSLSHADGTPDLLAPYGEVGVAALVTRKPSPRGLPLLSPTMHDVGGFILDLPVTTAEACELGRKSFGLPKFVADMDFREEPTMRQVTIFEDDAEILTLRVRPGGRVSTDHAPVIMYSASGGDLIETTIRFSGHRQIGLGSRAGRLAPGSHPVADRLRSLSVSGEPLVVYNYLDARTILPSGTPVGTAGEYPGYVGKRRFRGRLTVEYPGTGPIDQYTVPRGILHPASAEPAEASSG
jgi:hypothetical protein